jgi:hypothetical protein
MTHLFIFKSLKYTDSMKLIVSIFAFALLIPQAHSADCSPQAEMLMQKFWKVQPNARDSGNFSYVSEDIPAKLRALRFKAAKTGFVETSTPQKLQRENTQSDLLGVSYEYIKSSSRLVKTGYLETPVGSHFKYKRSDDFSIQFDANCKIDGFAYSRPTEVYVSAEDCIKASKIGVVLRPTVKGTNTPDETQSRNVERVANDIATQFKKDKGIVLDRRTATAIEIMCNRDHSKITSFLRPTGNKTASQSFLESKPTVFEKASKAH